MVNGLEETYHNYIGEAFWSLLYTYAFDPNWNERKFEGENVIRNPMDALTRMERKPGFYSELPQYIKEEIDDIIRALRDKLKPYNNLKKEWLEKYKNASDEMKARKDNGKCTLIGIEIACEDEDNIQEKIAKIQKMSDGIVSNDEKVIIYIIGNDYEKIRNQVQAIIPSAHIKTSDCFEAEIDEVKSNNSISKWVHITDSELVMKHAVESIKKGACPPVMFSMPNTDASYIELISEVFATLGLDNVKSILPIHTESEPEVESH